MEKVNFFGHSVTRLIIGDNPMNGHSYITYQTPGAEMKSYYTAEKIKAAYRHLEETGYNTMLPLADPYIIRLLQEYQTEGGNLQCIWQPFMPMDQQVSMRELKTLNTIGIYHQGTTTDYLYETGNTEKIRNNLKMWRELGVPVGLGTHYPEVIELSESEGWDVDFYVACLQNARRGRTGEESGFLTGKSKTGLVFYPEDRPIMLNTLRQIQKPVIAFKIFAGGQMFFGLDKTQIREKIKSVYEEVFSVLKPDDMAAIGVFQRDEDQILENYQLYEEWSASRK
ncbi:MAG: hypothetical protein IKV57_03350 [Clostridia bacterium]|nr:hypothetical protein [Clostridia bacterium]